MNDSTPALRAPRLAYVARAVPNTSMLPGSHTPPAPAKRFLERAASLAHDTIDRLSGRATTRVERLDEWVAAAQYGLPSQTRPLGGTRKDWFGGLRATVRNKPLGSVAAALAVGVVFARIARIARIAR